MKMIDIMTISDVAPQFAISKSQLKQIIKSAVNKIDISNSARDVSEGQYHQLLSQQWVESFAKAFEKHYKDNAPDNTILAYHKSRNKTEPDSPNRGEYLFDITLAASDAFMSSHNKTEIQFITQPIWQIESEFRQNMREIADDFQKLIAGNAPWKMMVGPLNSNANAYLTDMAHLAKYVHSTVLYFLLLPHPGDWATDGPEHWTLHKWNENKWQEVKR